MHQSHDVFYFRSSSIAAIVQTAVKDPATNWVDAYNNGNGSANGYVGQSAEYSSNTLSGHTLVAFAVMAYDAAYTITNVSDSVNGDWTPLGALLHAANPCNSHIAVYAKFNASPLLITSWSGTGAVSSGGVLTIGAGTGTFRLGQRILSASTPVPSGGQSFGGSPDVDNIVMIVSLLSGTLGASGSTYQLNPNINAVTFASEAMTTRDFVAVTRFVPTGNSYVGDYPGTWLLELSGTGSAGYFSGNNDTPIGAGTDTVTSGAISAPAVAGMVIGFCFDGGLNNYGGALPGPADQYYASPGTGWSNSSTMLSYNIGSAICTAEWKHVSNINGQNATFSPPKASDYSTVAIAIPDGP